MDNPLLAADPTTGNPLSSAVMSNPVGTQYYGQTMQMPQPSDPLVYMGQDGPVMQSQLDAARQKMLDAHQAVMATILGMSGDAPGTAAPIRAFHGSPHDFDAFDLSKIGTGEGAQAYGHGLYFAGNEGVAADYRGKLSPKGDQEALAMQLADNLGRNWSDLSQVEKTSFIDEVTKNPGVSSDLGGSAAPKKVGGRMYEVNIHADPQQLLDWDKPLSEQSPQVRAALTPSGLGLNAAGPFPGKGYYGYVDQTGRRVGALQTGAPPKSLFDDRETGMGLYKRLHDDPAAASAALREAGIPGIQYLDQGSRAAGEGTRNYVMFDPKLIKIVRKYAVPGFVGASAIPASMGGSAEQ